MPSTTDDDGGDLGWLLAKYQLYDKPGRDEAAEAIDAVVTRARGLRNDFNKGVERLRGDIRGLIDLYGDLGTHDGESSDAIWSAFWAAHTGRGE